MIKKYFCKRERNQERGTTKKHLNMRTSYKETELNTT